MSPMLTLAASQWLVGGLVVLGIVASVLMILTILIQRPQGGGLSAAFGGAGAGSGQTAFGAKTGDALTIMTIVVFIFWLLVSMGLVYATKQPTGGALGATKQTAPAEEGAETEDGPTPTAGSLDAPRMPEAVPPAAPVEEPAQTPAGEAGPALTDPVSGDDGAKTDDAATAEGGGR